MAKSLDDLDPAITFPGVVKFNSPGRGEKSLKFDFRFHDGKEMRKLLKEFQDLNKMLREDQDESEEAMEAVMDMHAEKVMKLAAGWELSDEWSKENILRLLNKHQGLFFVIFQAFIESHNAAKVKN